jgi:geranylgeranyl diphosphate synthase type II
MRELQTIVDKSTALDRIIQDYFESRISDATKIDSSYRMLWETLYGLIRSGGKRLRPHMTLMAYRAFGGDDETSVLPVAAAQELLHFSLLIHDDVIDRDYTRYNTLNIAGKYRELYAKYLPDTNDQFHFAHSAAILGGDLMLSGAHQLIDLSPISSSKKTIAQQLLSLSVFEVAGGELLDTESSFVPYTNGDAIKIARYKTAGYSFKIPLLTGAKLAGISPEHESTLTDFAESLGIAFQLVDDLLGTFGEEETTGKSTTSDITEGKRTYMVEHAVNVMSAGEKAEFDKYFGNHEASPSEIENVKQLFVSTGAKSKTEQMIADYAEKARGALAQLGLSDEHANEFSELIRKVTERAY